MENKSGATNSPIMISAGLIVIIVVTLVVLGFFAIRQAPTDSAATDQGANTAAVADTAPTAANANTTVTETPTTTDSEAVTAVVTDTASAAVTATTTAAVTATTTTVTDTAAAVTTTAAVSSTAVTSTAPLTATTGATTTATTNAAVDMAAVTAAVTKGTCGACHTIPGLAIAVGMIGPNLSAIGTDAATRIPGYTAEAYIRESILNPNAFIAPKCPTGDCLPGVMLPNLAELLTPAEIDTIVGYLLTLKGQ